MVGSTNTSIEEKSIFHLVIPISTSKPDTLLALYHGLLLSREQGIDSVPHGLLGSIQVEVCVASIDCSMCPWYLLASSVLFLYMIDAGVVIVQQQAFNP
jgi:hypothetical protein